ncbi:MAG: cbb3-type cytochrome c oxidase subunit I [Spirochaetota bacterium]|nr:cbb3-type cytochrome c oxidase subunit I [Spirochaetota bacterium]
MEKISQPVSRVTGIWIITTLVLFVVLALVGFSMRLVQSDVIPIPPGFFYAKLTLHGLGMAGTMFVGGLAAVWYLLARYVKLSVGLMKIVFVLVLLGVVGLVTATLVGQFATGWYVLYPLPFVKTAWGSWATGLAIISLMLLGVGWLLAQLDILRAIISKYGIGGFLGWNYLSSGEVKEETPPIVLISSVSTVVGSLATVVGAAMLMMYLIQWISPDITFSALLMKNMVFLFGHTIVNITMYFGVAVVYELLPKFSGRPWKTNKIVAISWNMSLIFVLVAYFHHLYMDFAQPVALQYLGQFASYLSAVPATVVTVFGVLAQVYKKGITWSYVPTALAFGVMGWIIGGFIAVVDSTIMVNVIFHNTLWVPSHFHTYYIMGFVLMLFAFIFDYFAGVKEKLAKVSLWSMIIGGYGFLTTFAIAGVLSVPRRYASYKGIPIDSVANAGVTYALIGSIFVALLLVGIIIFYMTTLGNFKKKWSEG